MSDGEVYEEYEPQHKAEESGPLLSNKTYDRLKFVAQILLPGLGALYFSLAGIWGAGYFPNADQVVGTVAAVDLFLGLFLGQQSRAYNRSDAKYDGAIEVEHRDDDSKMFSLSLNSDPEELENKREVVFKVKPNA